MGQRMDRLILSPAARRDAIVQFLGSARHTIFLSMFRCDDLRIVDELAAAVKRGVKVRILITPRARGWKQKLKDLAALLQSFGADVRPYESSDTKYHAKYIVVDDGPALVTSLNFTRKCFENTCDFLVFTEKEEVIAGLKALFEKDWATPGSPLPDISDRIIIGPDRARQCFMELLGSADDSIRIIDHRVTDPQVLALLRDKLDKDISVRIIGNLRTDGLLAHGRMILVDRRIAVIGSFHLSPPSLDWRREVALVIDDPPILTELYDYFENLVRDA